MASPFRERGSDVATQFIGMTGTSLIWSGGLTCSLSTVAGKGQKNSSWKLTLYLLV
jgi:hypothetical protein